LPHFIRHWNIPYSKVRRKTYARSIVSAAEMVRASATSKTDASSVPNTRGTNATNIVGTNSRPMRVMYHTKVRYPIDASVDAKSLA
jgi:hypothetical protein